MLQFSLKSYEAFKKMSIPLFGPDLSKLDSNSYTYFINQVKLIINGVMFLKIFKTILTK